jgi:hypothetical protein
MTKVLVITNAEATSKSFQVFEETRKKVAILVDFHQVGTKTDACFTIGVDGSVTKQYHETYWVKHIPNVTDINNKRFIVISLEYYNEKIASQEQINSLATIILNLSKIYNTIRYDFTPDCSYNEKYFEFAGVVMASNVIEGVNIPEDTLIKLIEFFADKKEFASAYLTNIEYNYLAEEVVESTINKETADDFTQEKEEELQEVNDVSKKKKRE